MASLVEPVPLLGLCDGELDPKRYRSSFRTNKVGGLPDWLPLIARPRPRCGLCGTPSALVAQVYCPLQAATYHRNLHLFACSRGTCSGRPESWTALRSQSLEAEMAAARGPRPVRGAPPAATDWCEQADDWGVEEAQEETESRQTQSEDGEMLFSSHMQTLSLEEETDAHVFRPMFISVVEESELYEDEEDLEHAKELLREYERKQGAVTEEGSDGGGAENYEKTRAKHGDAVFSRFMKSISWCPQQVLRYCRGGRPLFISSAPSSMAQALPRCGSCGGSRTFELQLMPALVSLLQRTERAAGAELEFGTVLVYTCTSSCWTPGSELAVEEFCFVQADPDQQLFQ
ncbi:programmed cell death protein 2-like [Oryzias latipes]|uniref:Programmed cell death 2-like n=1 Tax=Oryzias latipes TaxID=8090 RepID=H2L5D4_ORYLA|nr:programmed cell death protein 2-like [Oryzias latipes]